MKPSIRFIIWFVVFIPLASACSPPAPAVTASPTPALPPTETAAPTEAATRKPSLTPTPAVTPTATATPEPTLTPTPVVLALEILEWSEWPYANLADPSNTDTHVEVLIRNPNAFPVRVNREAEELRFINAAGKVVYTNPSPFFYIWQGEWMLPGETAALSACVCFQTGGLEKQEWESLELIAPLQIATDIAYTLDVEVKLGVVVDIAKAHLGGSGFALETTLTNTSDQALESVPHRVLAWDTDGRYVGVAFFGNAVPSFTENIAIQPGDTATGLNVIDIEYVDTNAPLRFRYEVAAIGIPAKTAVTALPVGTPLADWNGIPIMPGALAGEVANESYQFTTQANLDAITSFYETELSKLGYELELNVDETVGQAIMSFRKGAITGMIVVAPLGGGLNGVGILINP